MLPLPPVAHGQHTTTANFVGDLARYLGGAMQCAGTLPVTLIQETARMFRRLTSPGRVLVVLLVLAGLASPAAAQSAPTVQVTLFHDTHLHGQLEGPDGVTFGHYVGLMGQQRARLPAPAYSLFLGNGDDIAPSLMSAVFGGQHIIDSFNAAGLDVDTFGNHEFDLGPDRLVELSRGAKYPLVSANVRDVRTGDVFGAEAGVKKWVVKTVGGIRFGFTGLAPVTTPEASSPGPNAQFLDPVAAMREVVPLMRADGAQVVVLLSHLCTQDTEAVAAQVSGIDVAVGDHCAQSLERPVIVNGTIVSRRGDELRYLGQLDLFIDSRTGRIDRFEFGLHKTAADGPLDAATDTVLQSYKARLDAELAAPVATTTIPLEVTRPVMRSGEAPAGNLVADALRFWGKSDVALQNGGGVRGERTYGPGVLTRKDVAEMLPFANYGTLLRVSGTQLLAALENGVSQVEQQAGRFPQVSGMTITYDPEAPAGARVREVLIGGRPLDPAGAYTLTTIDFIANGGDGYDALKGGDVLIPGSQGPLQTAMLLDYLSDKGTVSPDVEGRIRTFIGMPSFRAK
jgi:2',3'-cyclic-nucleotide 2'-phosphodiesterase/3'-nucleotidase